MRVWKLDHNAEYRQRQLGVEWPSIRDLDISMFILDPDDRVETRKRLIHIGAIIWLSMTLVATPASCRPIKKLIEFGWDEPDAAFLHKHYLAMEKTPFDGCVFHVNYGSGSGIKQSFAWECWGNRTFYKSEFQTALRDLRSTPFKRFRYNFLRFNVSPGNIDWFDDFTPVLNNARLAGEIARETRSAGILFDIEQYAGPVFNYKAQRHHSRLSWKEYAAQTRLRGQQVMRAFQERFPGIRIFLTFGFELPWTESGKGARPLADGEYGLLSPFLDGMFEAATGKAKLIDGFEYAYSFRQPAQFATARREMTTGVLPIVSDAKRYRRYVTFSFGIWLEGNWRQHGWNTENLSLNFHDPSEFERVTRAALQQADEFVWIYSEKPRWWTSPEGSSADLPQAYQQALRAARSSEGRSRYGGLSTM